MLESGTQKSGNKSHAEVGNRGMDCLILCIEGGFSLLVATYSPSFLFRLQQITHCHGPVGCFSRILMPNDQNAS